MHLNFFKKPNLKNLQQSQRVILKCYYICFLILYCLLAQKKWKLKNGLRLPTLPYIFIYMYNSLKTITAVLIREAWKGKPQKSTLKCSFSITNQSVIITFQGSVTFIKHRVLKICVLKIRVIKICSVQIPNSQVYGDEINGLFERLYNASQRRHWEIIFFFLNIF